jgi:tetratricopeptide (TPR) repeat protein
MKVYGHLGHTNLELGEVGAARDYFRQGLAVAEALTTAGRNDPRARHLLLACYSNLGTVSRELGEPAAAREYYRKGLAVAQALAAADRNDAEARRDLATLHGHLGDVHLDLGEAVTARDHYRQGLELAEALVAADRNDAQALRELALLYGNLGSVCMQLGEMAAARDYFRKGLERAEARAAADPKNVEEGQKLAGFYGDLGKVSAALGERAAARDYYRKALGRAEASAADRSNSQAQWDLACLCHRLGELEEQEFEYAKALLWHERALAILGRLQAEGKDKAQPEFARLVEYVRDGITFCRLVPRAVADLDFALAQPPRTAAELLLARAAVLTRAGRLAEAAAAADRLPDLDPKEPAGFSDLAGRCARCISLIAPGKSPDRATGADKALRERLSAAAVGLLRKAVASGYRDRQNLETHPDLEPLRARADFRKLIQDLGGKPAP